MSTNLVTDYEACYTSVSNCDQKRLGTNCGQLEYSFDCYFKDIILHLGNISGQAAVER